MMYENQNVPAIIPVIIAIVKAWRIIVIPILIGWFKNKNVNDKVTII